MLYSIFCRKISIALFMVILLALSVATPVYADELKGEEMASMVDSVITSGMAQYKIPGAVMSVVKDGRIAAMKGYGWADVEKRIAPDPSHTVFRIASVSKLITATAVMQQYEQGHLELDTDVNRYLKNFRIPDTYSEPITLRHILRHTTGLDESSDYGLVTYDLDHQAPLSAMLKKGLPARIRAPGEVTQYNNYAYALAGLLVENTSGTPFETYVDEHIFKPLGMKSSNFLLSRDIQSRLAKSYYLKDGRLTVNPTINTGVRPSGSMNSTAEDMARFMLAQLAGGSLQGSSILAGETVELMQTQQFADYPGFEGYGFGFYCLPGGLEHKGSFNSYNSYLLLLPSQNAGVFIATNMGSDAFVVRTVNMLKNAFLRQSGTVQIQGSEDHKGSIEYEGAYIPIRSPQKAFAKVFRLLPGNGLMLTAQAAGKQLKIGEVLYNPVRTDVFQSIDRSHYVYFKKDSEGRMCLSTSNGISFVRIPFYENPKLNIVFVLVFGGAFLASAVIGIVLSVRRSIRHRAAPADKWILALSGINLIFFILLYLIPQNFDPILTLWPYYLLLALPLLSILGVLGLLAKIIRDMRKKEYRWFSLSASGVFLLVCCAFLLFLWNWNLIGFNLY